MEGAIKSPPLAFYGKRGANLTNQLETTSSFSSGTTPRKSVYEIIISQFQPAEKRAIL